MGAATVAAPAGLRGPYVKPPKPPAGAEALTCSTPLGGCEAAEPILRISFKASNWTQRSPVYRIPTGRGNHKVKPEINGKGGPSLTPPTGSGQGPCSGSGIHNPPTGKEYQLQP